MDLKSFTDADGVEVFYRAWPCAEAKASIVIAHGASEHSGRYGRFAEALNNAGYAAVAIDHRGHGLTGKSTGPGLVGPGGGSRLVDDLHQLVELTSDAAPDRPVILFGHSMGSMIAQAYAIMHSESLAAYVLSGCPGAREGVGDLIAGLQAAVAGGMGDEPFDALGASTSRSSQLELPMTG